MVVGMMSSIAAGQDDEDEDDDEDFGEIGSLTPNLSTKVVFLFLFRLPRDDAVELKGSHHT